MPKIKIGKPLFPMYTIWRYLIASSALMLLSMPYVLTQYNEDVHTVEATPALSLRQKGLAKKEARSQAVGIKKSIFEIIPTPMSSFGMSSNNLETLNSVAMSNFETEAENFDEARYNLATRIMANGVEVIIAGDKSKSVGSNQNVSFSHTNEFQLAPHQTKKPVTLAPSTLSSHMILLIPNILKSNLTIPIHTNQFVTKTCLTTYTYRTTYLQDGVEKVESQEKVITNIATEEGNYPKINSTLSKGVTLTSTPKLAVGIFPTTYSYFFTLHDDGNTKMLASEHTVINTITAPEDYISYLQPSEAATPIYDTNTYFNKILITKTLDKMGLLQVTSNSETLTQVIVTESLPARSTLLLTSYNAFDVDNEFSQSMAPESPFPTQSNYNLHIYATKTLLTTFTYLTTTTAFLTSSKMSQDMDNSSSLQEMPEPSISTAVNYHTRVIETVVSQVIPTTFLKPELIMKFRNELKRGKNHRGVIVTLATLLDGQTLEITAMEYINPKNSTAFQDHSTDTVVNVQTTVSKVFEPEATPVISSLKNAKPLEIEDVNQPTDQDSNYESSNLIPTVINFENSKNNLTKDNFENEISPQTPTHFNVFGSLNGFTVLRPVFNAMADLLQSKFISHNVPEIKSPLKNFATNTKHELHHKNPIYVPFQNTHKKSNKNSEGALVTDGGSFDVVPPQSLHIKPPEADLAITDDNWINGNYISADKNFVGYNVANNPNQKPLINGGIPIRPGEIITANSDVIVGRPNGIEQPKVYNYQTNIIPLRRGVSRESISPYGFAKNVTYNGQNSFKYAFPGLKYSKHTTLRPIENYDNILRPPPFPKYSVHNQLSPRPPQIATFSLEPPISHSNFQSALAFSRDTYRYPQKTHLENTGNENDVTDIKGSTQVLSTELRTPDTLGYQFSKQEAQNQFQLRVSPYSPSYSSKAEFPPDLESKKFKHQNGVQFKGSLSVTPLLPNLRQHSNHQRISLQTNVLSHNIAINVPPLTFKKEPEPATPVLHGIPSNSGPITMPHIKIQANEDEVQVNLTPQHRIYQESIIFKKSPSTSDFKSSPKSNDKKSKTNLMRPNRNKNNITTASEVDARNRLPYSSNAVKTLTDDMTKVVKPTSVLKSLQTVPSAVDPFYYSNNKWDKNQSNSESSLKINDIAGAFSTLKNQHILSEQPNDLSHYNISQQAQSTNHPHALLNPLTALQVNYLYETSPSPKSVHTTEFPSKIKLNYSSPDSNKSKITSHSKQSHHPFSHLKAIPSASKNTLRNSSNTIDIWKKSNSSFTQSQTTLGYQKKIYQTTVSPRLSFSYGQPFKQPLVTHNIGSNNEENRKTYADNHVYITSGQSFKLKNPPSILYKNISNIPLFLNTSQAEFDRQRFLIEATKGFKVKPSIKSSTSEFRLLYPESPSLSQHQMSPIIQRSETYVNKSPELQGIKTELYRQFSSPILTSSKPIPTIQTTVTLSKKSNSPIKNVNYKSSTAVIATMQSTADFAVNYIKNNHSFIPPTIGDFKTISKHSTPIQTEVISSPTEKYLFTESYIDAEDYLSKTEAFIPAITSDHEDQETTTKRQSQIDLAPSTDTTHSVLTSSIKRRLSPSSIFNKSSNLQHSIELYEPIESTPSLSKFIQVTNFITHTVTTTKTTILTSTLRNIHSDVHSKFQMTTFYLTSTFTTTIVDTVTETQSSIQPTRTVYADYDNLIETSIAASINTNSNFLLPETRKSSADIPKYATLRNKNIQNSVIDSYGLNSPVDDTDNIFIVMTNRQGAASTKTSLNTSHIDSYEELAMRDEEIFLGAEDGVNKILLGGVLLEIPSSNSNILSTRVPDIITSVTIDENSTASRSSGCRPACKTSRNEFCSKSAARYECICRPGFARMFPDRKCKPTYTYKMRIGIKRLADHELLYDDTLSNDSTEQFQELATITHDALERMVMQSDFRDVYQGVVVESFSLDSTNQTLIANALLQFSDINDEQRLQDGFKKYLRANGYNIGLTELYTDQKEAEMITVKDFDECLNPNFHDCAENARCFNLKATYTCNCNDGYLDLSENPLFPGRSCSSEIIGCEKCNYHGQCVSVAAKAKLKDESIVCDCFAWYAGSVCQLNLKILLIALMAIGSILFVILLLCILLTCMKHRKSNGPILEALFAEVQDVRVKPTGLIDLRVDSKASNKTINFQTILEADKRAIIVDTSSESSDCSLPYVLKDSIRRERKQHRKLTTVHKEIEKNECVPVIKELLKENHSSGVKPLLPTFRTCPSNAIFTEIEQSDRSLTVMIPRAKYHPSVLPQAKFLHHQLTLERKNGSSMKNLNDFHENPDPGPNEKPKISGAHNISGASLVSAGFEVSATVNPGSSRESPNTNEQLPGSSLDDSIGTRCQYNSTRLNGMSVNPAQKSIACNVTMEEWLQNMQGMPSSTDGQWFGDSTFCLVKCDKKDQENQTIITNEEANTMAERDVSMFLLPHTHLYKPEKDSDFSGLDSL